MNRLKLAAASSIAHTYLIGTFLILIMDAIGYCNIQESILVVLISNIGIIFTTMFDLKRLQQINESNTKKQIHKAKNIH
jgi:hypothetical protein